MRFVQFIRKNCPKTCLGVISADGNTLTPLITQATDMVSFISQNPDICEIEKQVEESTSEPVNEDITILAPVTNPEKIACIGLNYMDYCKEQNRPPPKESMFFSKFASAIVGPCGDVIAHKMSKKVDWEVELAIVIGKAGKQIPKEEALDYVFGYTIAQDISARDWQKERNGGQFLIGKSMDSFCPLGPAIVHKSLIEDPHNLQLTTKINGVEKQNGSTKDLIYKIEDIIHELTQGITVKPGDVILTGTPAGVGLNRNPPEYLKPGDLIESEIESIGKMWNPVVEDC